MPAVVGVPDPARPNAWSVYSEMRSLLVARGVPPEVVRFAQDRAIPFTHFRSLFQTTEVRELIGQIVEDANRSVPSAAVVAFELIERHLKLGDPEIGPASTFRHYLLPQHRGSVEHTSSMNRQSAQ